MERLTHAEAHFPDVGKVMLKEQYRMHPLICKAVSACFYDHRLTTNSATSDARKSNHAVAFIELKGANAKVREGATSMENAVEADTVVRLVEHMYHARNVDLKHIHVLTFYSAQR